MKKFDRSVVRLPDRTGRVFNRASYRRLQIAAPKNRAEAGSWSFLTPTFSTLTWESQSPRKAKSRFFSTFARC
jgi:hypothetical protein